MTELARRRDAGAAARVSRGVSRPARGASHRYRRVPRPSPRGGGLAQDPTSTGWPDRAARTASPRSASSRARWSSGWRPSRRPARRPRLDEAVERLAALFRQAQARLGTPDRAAGTPAPRDHHPAALAGDRAARRRPAGARGTTCGWATGGTIRPRCPPGERPDLLVIGAAAGEGDPSAVASVWTGQVRAAPRGRAGRDAARGGPAAGDRLRAWTRSWPSSGWPRIFPDTPAPWPGPAPRLPPCSWSSTTPSPRPPRTRVPRGGEHPGRPLRARAGGPGAAGAGGARSHAARDPPAGWRRRHGRPHRPRGSPVPDDADRLHRPGGRGRAGGGAPGGRGRLPATPADRRAAAADGRRAGRARAPPPRAAHPRPADRPAQPRHPAGRAGVRGGLRPPAWRTAVAAGVRPRPVPRGERAVRPAGRRPGPAPRGQRVPLERAGERPHRPLWRRGVRHGAAGRAAPRARRWWRPSCAGCSASSRPPRRRG